MIKYAGVPQLGDYVVINDKPENVRVVATIVMNVDTAIKYFLDNNSIIGFEQDDLTRVKPNWNVGELVRYKGRVHQILIIEVKNYKFVYSLDNIGQWIAEDELEEVNSIRYLFRPDDWISVNKYCADEQLRGMKGRIKVISYLGANCSLRGIGPQSYDIPWEAIDVIEEKVEPYNAKLICVESNDRAWEVGNLAIVEDNGMYFLEKDTGKKLCVAENVDCLDAVNKFFPRVTFAEIKETIGNYNDEEKYWNGKIYVVGSSSSLPFEKGKMYIVTNGLFYDKDGYEFGRYKSFKEIQRDFPRATLIEVKED